MNSTDVCHSDVPTLQASRTASRLLGRYDGSHRHRLELGVALVTPLTSRRGVLRLARSTLPHTAKHATLYSTRGTLKLGQWHLHAPDRCLPLATMAQLVMLLLAHIVIDCIARLGAGHAKSLLWVRQVDANTEDPFNTDMSEDCLFLNVYAPIAALSTPAALPGKFHSVLALHSRKQ